MSMPQEIIGLIFDHLLLILPDKGIHQLNTSGKLRSISQPMGHEGLVQVNTYFENEFYGAVKRANVWVRNICFDDGDDGNDYLMSQVNKLINPCTIDVRELAMASFVSIHL